MAVSLWPGSTNSILRVASHWTDMRGGRCKGERARMHVRSRMVRRLYPSRRGWQLRSGEEMSRNDSRASDESSDSPRSLLFEQHCPLGRLSPDRWGSCFAVTARHGRRCPSPLPRPSCPSCTGKHIAMTVGRRTASTSKEMPHLFRAGAPAGSSRLGLDAAASSEFSMGSSAAPLSGGTAPLRYLHIRSAPAVHWKGSGSRRSGCDIGCAQQYPGR